MKRYSRNRHRHGGESIKKKKNWRGESIGESGEISSSLRAALRFAYAGGRRIALARISLISQAENWAAGGRRAAFTALQVCRLYRSGRVMQFKHCAWHSYAAVSLTTRRAWRWHRHFRSIWRGSWAAVCHPAASVVVVEERLSEEKKKRSGGAKGDKRKQCLCSAVLYRRSLVTAVVRGRAGIAAMEL